MNNRILQISLALLSSVSLTSCFQQEKIEPTPLAQTSNVIYLQSVVTKNESALTKFNSLITQGNVIVDFYADWCGPCKAMSGTISQLAQQYPNVTFLKVNTDMFPEISSSIKSIPTLVFYKNGQQLYRQSGALSAPQMRGLIQKYF